MKKAVPSLTMEKQKNGYEWMGKWRLLHSPSFIQWVTC